MRLQQASSKRRGVILMVVLAMLTLFAIVGLSFVLYASAEATSARIAREAESVNASAADMDPRLALSLFLGQLIYDSRDDSTGITSAIRGSSLARSMYGYNYTVNGNGQIFPVDGNNVPLNTIAYNGTGRLNYPDTAANNMPASQRVNYIYTGGAVTNPERVGTGTAANPSGGTTFVGGFNPPYTYPDLNNFFLAAVMADGTVISPSFHRSYLFGALNDPNNPNWQAPSCFYLTPRPSPVVNPGFPYPGDAGGDVKNLVWAPGGNDSIWIDIGAPVMTAPDGTLFKMLVAPLIMDLDGRVNLNAAGNILGPAATPHVSNQGYGPWEINLARIISNQQDYMQLFKGATVSGSQVQGKYGPNQTPSGGESATLPPWPPILANPPTNFSGSYHYYAPGDLNGLNESAPPYSSTPTPPTGTTAPAPWATFAQGYQSGGGTELQNHPALYNLYRSSLQAKSLTGQANDDRVFTAADMDAIVRPAVTPAPQGTQPPAIFQSDTGNGGLLTDLQRLCPNTFGPQYPNPRPRGLVTTISNDLGVPGSMPWWYTPSTANNNNYGNAANPLQAPFIGQPLAFPPLAAAPAGGTSPITVTQPSEFNQYSNLALGQAVLSTLGRINLNQQLVPYPHMGSGFVPPYGAPLVSYGTPYDQTKTNIMQQYNAAVQARQNLANDIYRRLLNLTGINGNSAGDPNQTAHRWLAQLAVNIVDYIDEDDVSTPFNFYNTQDNPTANVGATAGGDTDNTTSPAGPPPTGANPSYWVFGTELPRVVLNEVLVESNYTAPSGQASSGANVLVWAELFNPMLANSAQTPNVQPYDFNRVPLYMAAAGNGGYSPYRISISNALMTNGLQPNANVLGKTAITAPTAGPPATTGYPFETTDTDFSAVPPQIGGGGNQATPGPGNVSVAGVDPQSFFLIGPPKDPTPNLNAPANTNNPFQDPFVPQNTNPNGVPNNVPVVRTASMVASESFQAATDERTTGLTVCLRRLANPYLPYNGTPTAATGTYNPYVTVDYLSSVPINQVQAGMAQQFSSRGKTQPYAAFTQLQQGATAATSLTATSPVMNQQGQQVNSVTTTFGLQNAPAPVNAAGAAQPYNWLVFLDRVPVSPIELLQVSGYQPYQLTQQFMTGDPTVPATAYQHLAPWVGSPSNASLPLDPTQTSAGASTLLYRLLEHFECGNRATGVDAMAYTPSRIPGKINLNTIWDPETFLALCDANSSLGSPAPGSASPPTWDNTIQQMFNNMMQSRSPGVYAHIQNTNTAAQLYPTQNSGPGGNPAGSDKPFLPLSVGQTGTGDAQYPQGLSFQNTILRANPNNPNLLLFESPNNPPANGTNVAMHPYSRYQLLSKIFNNVTTRSNTFAVFLTVGFFTVTNATATPPTLGPEVGIADGTNIRHRMLAIVDRTNLATFATPLIPGQNGGQAIPPPASPPQPTQLSTIMALSGTNPLTGAPWSVAAGMQLTVEPGTDNEETVTVQNQNGNLVATFLKLHPNPNLNDPSQSQVIINRGNPGPWQNYDMVYDPLVVPFFVIIQ